MAVRVIRPYLSEDEYLAKEGDSITRTTIELIGAHSRPTGVILRFEVTLQSGKTLIRGEGRVTQFHDRGREDQPSLSLRFTKLDAKSKALVDRAVAMRQPGGGVVAPAPSSPELHPLVAAAAPSSASGVDDTAPTPPPPAPLAGRNDTAPPPTPIVTQEQAAARMITVGDDPDPEGNAVTTPPPDVAMHDASDSVRAGATATATAPPPTTTRPSILPPAARAEMRRMSEQPPPLPSALPAYESAKELPRDPADEAAEEVVTSAATPATSTSGRRDELLSRLRERARSLPPDRVLEITRPRPRGVT